MKTAWIHVLSALTVCCLLSCEKESDQEPAVVVAPVVPEPKPIDSTVTYAMLFTGTHAEPRHTEGPRTKYRYYVTETRQKKDGETDIRKSEEDLGFYSPEFASGVAGTNIWFSQLLFPSPCWEISLLLPAGKLHPENLPIQVPSDRAFDIHWYSDDYHKCTYYYGLSWWKIDSIHTTYIDSTQASLDYLLMHAVNEQGGPPKHFKSRTFEFTRIID